VFVSENNIAFYQEKRGCVFFFYEALSAQSDFFLHFFFTSSLFVMAETKIFVSYCDIAFQKY
jgi:hypothetical protein